MSEKAWVQTRNQSGSCSLVVSSEQEQPPQEMGTGDSCVFQGSSHGKKAEGGSQRLSDFSERTAHSRRLARLARELAASARNSASLKPHGLEMWLSG